MQQILDKMPDKIYKFSNRLGMGDDIFVLTYDTLFRNARFTPVYKQLLQYFKVLDSKISHISLHQWLYF